MDFIGGYGSDSDDEKGDLSENLSLNKSYSGSNGSGVSSSNEVNGDNNLNLGSSNSSLSNSINNSSHGSISSSLTASSGIASTKAAKTKKLDISILPKNIQDALLRGDGGNDSDDNESSGIVNSKLQNNNSGSQSKLPSRNKLSTQEKQNDLISILPKPKLALQSAPLHFNISRGSAAMDLDDTTASTYDKSSSNNRVHGNEDDSDSSDNGDETMTQQNSAKESVELENVPDFSQQMKPGFMTLKSSVYTSHPNYNSSLNAAAQNSNIYNNDDDDSNNDQSGSYDVKYMNDSINNQGFSGDDSNVNGTANKRKREREIESLLMKGDISASNRLDVSLAEVDYSNYQWDQSEHDRQREREREIKSMYNLGNASITRTQNSKHQINSLVIKAQEAELRMASKPVKSKSQAASKYGW